MMDVENTADLENEEVAGAEDGAEILSGGENVSDEGGGEEEGVENGEAGAESKDVESLARLMGWVSKDEWQGEPPAGGHKSATEFVAGASRATKDLAESNRTLTAKVGSMEDTVRKFAEFHHKTEAAAYARALKDIQARQRTAVEESDTEAFEAAEAEKKALGEPPKEPEKAAENKQPDADPVFTTWQSANSWYGKDVEMTIYADQAAGILSGGPGQLRGQALYDAVANEIRSKFPEKFGNQRRKSPHRVEPGGEGGTSGRPKGWASLSDDAKAAGSEYINTGLYDVPGKELTLAQKQAAYASEYYAQDEE